MSRISFCVFENQWRRRKRFRWSIKNVFGLNEMEVFVKK